MFITTKANAASTPVKTNITFDFTDCPESTLQALAIQALVVKLQASYRKNGIPESATVLVKDHAPGTRQAADPLSKLEKLIEDMTPEQRQAFIAKHIKQAGGAV
jgi:hypothetical protein